MITDEEENYEGDGISTRSLHLFIVREDI